MIDAPSNRQDKVANFIKEQSASVLAKIDNKSSLITVTGADISPDLKRATLFITVLPEAKEAQALGFVERNLGEIRDHLKKNMATKIIPYLEVKIDLGEKNRQKIDQLLKE